MPDSAQTDYISPYTDEGFGLARISLILGIISLISMFLVPVLVTCVCAPLSIILAILSKGRNDRMVPAARNGTMLSAVALGITAAIVIFALAVVMKMMADPVYRMELSQMFESMYGMPMEDMFPPGLFPVQ